MLVALLYNSSIAWFSALPCWYAIYIYVKRTAITFNLESFNREEWKSRTPCSSMVWGQTLTLIVLKRNLRFY